MDSSSSISSSAISTPPTTARISAENVNLNEKQKIAINGHQNHHNHCEIMNNNNNRKLPCSTSPPSPYSTSSSSSSSSSSSLPQNSTNFDSIRNSKSKFCSSAAKTTTSSSSLSSTTTTTTTTTTTSTTTTAAKPTLYSLMLSSIFSASHPRNAQNHHPDLDRNHDDDDNPHHVANQNGAETIGRRRRRIATLLAAFRNTLSRSKYYLSSLRPGSFTTSLIPVLLGTTLAAKTTGQFSFVILLATVLTVISVHAAGNLVNTYCDFMRGIDSKDHRSDDRTLVDNILTPEEVVHLGVLFYVIGCVGFLIVVLLSPARMELLALIYFGGISSSFLYTGGIGLKYIALGDIIIMITFGPVSVLYSFIAQTGTIRLVSLLYAVPLALNTEAILHSNNARDIEHDRKSGCVTIAALLGPSASYVLFALLLFTPYILLAVGALHYSAWLLLPMITLTKAFALERQFRAGQLRHIPKRMARLNFYFGMLYLSACFLSSPHKLPGLFQF